MEILEYTVIAIIGIITFIAGSFMAYWLYDKITGIATEYYKDRQYKLQREDIYNNIDPEVIDENINKMLNKVVESYILEGGIGVNDEYISQEDINDIIKYCTKKVFLELSDMYKYYINLLVKLDSDEEMLAYLRNRIKYIVLDIASKNNVPSE